MREKIARWLRVYKLQEVEVDNETEDGIVPWDKASQETRDFWLKDTKELLTLITEEIEKVENPYSTSYKDGWVKGMVNIGNEAFKECRQAILKILEGK